MDLYGKSPKMWVNEISVKQLVQAKWDTKDAFPGQSPPTFICTCKITYSDRVLEAEGSGKTKKDAEQEAARAMLTKLEMTPAKLLALSNAAKNKENRFSTSTGTSHSSPGTGAGDAMDADDVSDTDEAELEAASNPIGELMAMCTVNDFDDPEYYEVKVEGPAHKRIFTMCCKVPELGIERTGRRNKKQVAKKLAGLRALSEMKSRGYKYSAFEDRNDGAEEETEAHGSSAADNVTLNDVNSILEGLTKPATGTSRFGKSILGITGVCDRGYCTDKSGKCMEYCVDYSHAFHHLEKSETLAELRLMNNSDSFSVLKKVAGELGISLISYKGGNFKNIEIVFIGMKLPFKFNMEVPNKSVLSGEGMTIEEAKNNAASRALTFLKTMIET